MPTGKPPKISKGTPESEEVECAICSSKDSYNDRGPTNYLKHTSLQFQNSIFGITKHGMAQALDLVKSYKISFQE